MKILTVATTFPYPPDDGTKIQRFERIRELSRRHDVTLLCISAERISPDAIREMERYCHCELITVPAFVPPSTVFGKVAQLVRSIALRAPYYLLDRLAREGVEWLEREVDSRQFDVVEADADSCIYLDAPMRARKVAIIHSVNETTVRRRLALTSTLVERLNLHLYLKLMRQFDSRLLGSVDLCVGLTPEIGATLRQLHSHANVRDCLSNGVDLDYFNYVEPDGVPQGICFVGKMDYKPNIDAVLWFYRTVFPLIRTALPTMRFSIIGGHPVEEVQALARDASVEVTGYVDDVRPYIRRAGLLVLPLRTGGGILNKLLQGLALGVPVVATPLALEGVGAVPDRDMLVAESPEGLAAAVIKLATDAALNKQLASSGRAYVETHHQWSAIVRRYETELDLLLHKRQPTGNRRVESFARQAL